MSVGHKWTINLIDHLKYNNYDVHIKIYVHKKTVKP